MSTQSSTQSESPTLASLAAIRPDPGQPRRLLPGDLAEAVSKGDLSPDEAMGEWLRRVEDDRAEGGQPRNFRELKRLADSIARHGLINPISVRLPQPEEVVPAEVTYFIVTGERRYWAYVYLWHEGLPIREGQATTQPDQIKITLASPGVTVRAQQLIENLLREDLNAVERARGMGTLRYELSGVNYSSPPTGQVEAEEKLPTEDSPSPTPSERSQMDDSVPQLVPWSQVEATLGISKRYRIFVTSVLRLSEAAQALISAHNLAEMTIRPITQKLRDKPDLQLKALQQLIAWQSAEDDDGPSQSIVASVKELVDQLLIEESTQNAAPAVPLKQTRSVSSAPVIRFRDKVRQTLDFLNRLKKSDRVELTQALNRGDFADVMIDLRNLREQIDAILNTASPTEVEQKMIPPLLPPSASPEGSDPISPVPPDTLHSDS